ncbi:MAG TPA: hypothetical protein VFP39_10030 [Gemmatimonadales bacterium]|nr:hypothetical protein [Gemmatimonadales bacterium]
MRILAITLVVAGSLAVMALGGGAIAADRAPRGRHSATAADSSSLVSASATATRLWYGGTLAPIQVQAPARTASAAAHTPACPTRN